MNVGPTKPIKRRGGRKIREVDDDMKSCIKASLKHERSEFMRVHCPQMSIIGPQFVCSDAIIDDICKISNSITSVEDIKYFFKTRITIPICYRDMVKDAPKAKRIKY